MIRNPRMIQEESLAVSRLLCGQQVGTNLPMCIFMQKASFTQLNITWPDNGEFQQRKMWGCLHYSYQETYTQTEVPNIPDPSTLYMECWLYQHNILMMLSSKTNFHHIVADLVMQKFTYNKPVAPR